MKRKALLLVLSFLLMIPNVIGIIIAKDLQDDEYISVNGLNVKFIAKYYGDSETGIVGDGSGINCSEVTDFSILFDGNNSTGVYLRDGSGTWTGHINTGDYIGVEFEQPINFSGITMVLDNDGTVNDTYQKSRLEYLVNGESEWQTLNEFDGKIATASYTVEGDPISNVKAVRLLNTYESNQDIVWVSIKEITVDGNLPGIGNYTEVNTAIAKTENLVKEDYDLDSFTALEEAVAAVVQDLDDTHQSEIDSFAQAINDAYDNLIKIRHEVPGKAVEIIEEGNKQNDDNGVAKIFDGNTTTLWHTNWNGSKRSTHYFIVKVPTNYYEKLELLPRPQNGTSGDENGVITKLNVYVKQGEDGEWVKVVDEAETNANGWQTVLFNQEIKADYIKVEVVDALSANEKLFASLAEMKIYYKAKQLNRNKWKAVAYFSNGNIAEYTDNAVAYEKSSGANANEGAAEYLFDGNVNTIYHTDYDYASQTYYQDPITIILKLGKLDTFSSIDWLNRTDVASCRLGKFDVYTIDDELDYTDEQLKDGAPWVKKFSITAQDEKDLKFYVGEQTTKYVKIVCQSRESSYHLTCAELNLYLDDETSNEIKYTGMNATLNSSDWIKESAYNQNREVKGFYGVVSGVANTFSNTEANLVKYITSKVLSVKAQSMLTDENKINVRFITSVASTNLERLRFKVEIIDSEGNIREKYATTNKVLGTIVADGVRISDPKVVFENESSIYFCVCKLNGIPLEEVDKGTSIRVTPYWAPADVEETDYENYVQGVPNTYEVRELYENRSGTNTINN